MAKISLAQFFLLFRVVDIIKNKNTDIILYEI